MLVPTDDTICALRAEAGEAGDLAMVAICDRASEGDADALVYVVEVLRYADAQRGA